MRLTVRQNLHDFAGSMRTRILPEVSGSSPRSRPREFLDRANGKLSAGQKTRVALAKALINSRLLLLDEPTASLDPEHRRLDPAAPPDLPQDPRRNHPPGVAHARSERLCDRVIIMKRGRIEDDDSPDKIMARYNRATLEEVFLDVARGRVQETTP